MKKPSSNLPPLEIMVWLPVRNWPFEMVSDALIKLMLREEEMKKMSKRWRRKALVFSVSMCSSVSCDKLKLVQFVCVKLDGVSG